MQPVLQVLAVGITSQPLSIPYSVTKFPLCSQTSTFTFSSNPSFVTKSPDGDAGFVFANGATQADMNLYVFTLTATADLVSATLEIHLDV